MQNKACFAEHGTPVCWALRVAQLQNPNSHLINTVGLDRPFCVALQEWVQRPLGFTLLGFSRYGREPVGPYLAIISRELIILAFCWYTKKAIEACIVRKNGMIGCKTRSASSHTSRNGKVLFYHSKCKTKPVLLSMVPPFAEHYVLPSCKIPIRILSTLWG